MVKPSILISVIFIYSSLILSLSSQTKEELDANPTNHSNKKKEGVPLKYEEGDVTIDLKIESERLKKLFYQNLQLLRPIFINAGKESDFENLLQYYTQGNSALLRGEARDSRRIFKEGLNLLDSSAKDFARGYQENFNTYSGELTQKLMKIKGETDKEMNTIAYIERRIQESGYLYRQAAYFQESFQPIHSIKYFQLSLQELLRGMIQANKEIEASLETDEEKKYSDLEYLKLEERKVWDDTHRLIHTETEEIRDKERKRLAKP